MFFTGTMGLLSEEVYVFYSYSFQEGGESYIQTNEKTLAHN